MLSDSKTLDFEINRDRCLIIPQLFCSGSVVVLLHFLKMGRKAKTAPEQESGPWMEASRSRLQKHAETRREAGRGVAENEFLDLGTRPRKALAAGELVAPARERQEFRTTEEVMAMVHRSGEEGLRPSGYSPDRHTVYICGRPVQVVREISWKH